MCDVQFSCMCYYTDLYIFWYLYCSLSLSLSLVHFQPVAAALGGDDRMTRISWKGDGEYFAISSVSPVTGARELRVWNRECVLHSTSEAMDGLEQALHWRYLSLSLSFSLLLFTLLSLL